MRILLPCPLRGLLCSVMAYVALGMLSVGQNTWAGDSSAVTSEPVESYPQVHAGIQSTYVGMKHPSFDDPYQGPSSLYGGNETGYTFTGTAYLGFRPWQGTEFWVDPEAASGVPFSGLLGVAGVYNGEAQKAAFINPITYVARAFLRQTFSLGGDQVQPDLEYNMFGGTVDSRRFVFTGGIYSITDIFDRNTFAHDPKKDFLNWSIMDWGAWDMPADARGYTRGVVGELYWDDWALRLSRSMLPVESNGLALTTNLTQSYADTIEVQHDFTIFDQDGKVRAMIFRNQAAYGNYASALNYAQTYGGVPDLSNVRTSQVKYGFGLSLEQYVTKDIGIFARLSWNNGETEGYSFTDIDNSVSGGVSINGHLWNRAGDTVGIGFASNGISTTNQAFLSAGGSDFFCGDGRLSYQRENIAEIYYSAQIAPFLWLTADYQRIANPCYNSDRGPVNVYLLRAHIEF